MEQQISLYFKNGSSDKEYHAQLQKAEQGYVVNFQYGRRGSTLRVGTKTNEPVELTKAQKIYDKLVKSKTSKGYTEGESGVKFQGNVNKENSYLAPQLLNEIKDEATLIELINEDSFYAQKKHDGERRMVRKTAQGVEGINKKGVIVPLNEDIANSFTEPCIVDAEQVANHLYVFDLRSYQGTNIEDQPYHTRLEYLQQASKGFGQHITVVYTADTTDEKHQLLTELQTDHQEGIILKRKDHQYQEGRPHSGGDVFKYKFYKTATVRVASHTEGKRSIHMEMLNENTTVPVGKVTIPSNQEIPPVGAYIEVRYLYAYKGGSLYQSTYLGDRSLEQDSSDINLSQLIYKNE